jgi:hypothetical protein
VFDPFVLVFNYSGRALRKLNKRALRKLFFARNLPTRCWYCKGQ